MSVPASVPASSDLSARQRRLILTGLMVAMFLAALDQTILGTALPRIAADLGSGNEISWVISAYLLAATITTPIHGKLSDLYGRKLLLQSAIVIFAGASLACALAQTLPQLVTARLIQGIGGGGLMTMAITVIADIVSPRERGRYQAYNATAWAVASLAGPALGGLFADVLSWRLIFWVNLPLGVAALLATQSALKVLSVRRVRHAIDYLGAILIASAASAAMLAATLGADGVYGWTSPQVLGLGLAAFVLGAGCVLQELHAREPILAPRLFRNHAFMTANGVSITSGAAMMGVTAYLPVYFQLVHAISALDSGLLVVPIFFAWPLSGAIVSRMVLRNGRYRIYPIVGAACALAGLILLAFTDSTTPIAQIVALSVLVGIGGGCIGPILVVSMQNSVPATDLGAATGGFSFFRTLGGSFGVALLGTIAIAGMDSGVRAIPGHESLGDRPGAQLLHAGAAAAAAAPAAIRDAVIRAIDAAFETMFIAAAVLMALAVIIAWLVREVPLRTTSGIDERAKPDAVAVD